MECKICCTFGLTIGAKVLQIRLLSIIKTQPFRNEKVYESKFAVCWGCPLKKVRPQLKFKVWSHQIDQCSETYLFAVQFLRNSLDIIL